MCNFKAKELLDLRRAIASDPTLTIHQIGLTIRIIDQARHEHFEATGCNCWDKARENSLPMGDVAEEVA